MSDVETARRALREAKIEEELLKNADMIERQGRCTGARGHPDGFSFFMGALLASVILLGILISIGVLK